MEMNLVGTGIPAGTIYTLSTHEHNAQRRLEHLLSGEPTTPLRAILIDVRFQPDKAGDPAWTGNALRDHWHSRYWQLGHFLGDFNQGTGQEVKLRSPEHGIAQVLWRLQQGTNVILLCDCGNEVSSHLLVVAQRVQAAMVMVEVK